MNVRLVEITTYRHCHHVEAHKVKILKKCLFADRSNDSCLYACFGGGRCEGLSHVNVQSPAVCVQCIEMVESNMPYGQRYNQNRFNDSNS